MERDFDSMFEQPQIDLGPAWAGRVRSFLIRALVWAFVLVAAAILSVPLALMSEGFALQHGFETPGLIASRHQVPPSSDHGFEALAKGMNVASAVDARIWFVLLCMLAIGVAIVRSRWARRAAIGRRERLNDM